MGISLYFSTSVGKWLLKSARMVSVSKTAFGYPVFILLSSWLLDLDFAEGTTQNTSPRVLPPGIASVWHNRASKTLLETFGKFQDIGILFSLSYHSFSNFLEVNMMAGVAVAMCPLLKEKIKTHKASAWPYLSSWNNAPTTFHQSSHHMGKISPKFKPLPSMSLWLFSEPNS